MRLRLLNVTDKKFLPGTIAAINSLLRYQKPSDNWELDIHVAWVDDGDPPLHALSGPVTCHKVCEEMGAWQTKSYMASNLMNRDDDWDVFVGFDSDLFFCGEITREAYLTHTDGLIRGGADQPRGVFHDEFEVYPNIKTGDPWINYFSTSCYFVPNREWTKEAWKLIAEYTKDAKYAGGNTYPGHGDQGITNATIASLGKSDQICLLNNNLWSQHWTAWSDTMGIVQGRLYNHTQKTEQRACHSLNFWTQQYQEEILDKRSAQFNIFTSFLGHLFFGPLRIELKDHWRLPELAKLAIQFLPAIQELLPEAMVTYDWLQPILKANHIHCMMPKESIRTYSTLVVDATPGTVVEVGSYQGGSILTLACLFAGRRDYNFISVESFSGDLNGKVDNLELPKIRAYRRAFETGLGLPMSSLCVPSHLAVNYFDDQSLSMVMIDAGHGADDVSWDIELWLPKIKPGGIIAGDDWNWPSVQQGIELSELGGVQHEGNIWWKQL